MRTRRATATASAAAWWARMLSAAMLVLACAGCAREPRVHNATEIAGEEDENDVAPRVAPERRSLDAISRGSVYAGMPTARGAWSRYEVLANEGYTVGYSERRKSPLWAAYQLFRIDQPAHRATPHAFTPDDRTQARVDEACYAHSGYARGRQAPSYGIGTRYGEAAQRATLFMSNVSPRLPKLERQTWRALERLEADELAQQLGRVWVITGPIFREGERQSPLPCGVEIPNAFYKIIVAEVDGTPIALPVIMTQEDNGRERLRNFTTTIDQIEELTGLDFFPELPVEVETAIESTLDFDPHWDVDRMLTPPGEPR
jgi:endonuclease G